MSSLPDYRASQLHSDSDGEDVFGLDDGLRSSKPLEPPKRRKPFIIGVCGGTASGKTTVCERIIEELKDKRAAIISQDCFYRPLTPEQARHVQNYNFDHPDALDFGLMVQTLKTLCEEGSVKYPDYDFKTHQRSDKRFHTISGAEVIIFEGILAFHDPELLALYDMRLFVDTDDDTRLIRRIRRDIAERGRDLMGVLAQYERFVKPAYDTYIAPSKKFADVIIPRGGDNVVAIDMLVKHIKARLSERGRRSPPQGRFLPPYRPPAGQTAPAVSAVALSKAVPVASAAAASSAAAAADGAVAH